MSIANAPALPPVLYLPCVAHVSDPAQARVELRETKDGRVALLAYTALDRLVRCCGHGQPWVLATTEALENLQRQYPFQLLMLDVMVPPHRRTHPG
jgi:hypothetical protein